MPELPEVECIRRTVAREIVGRDLRVTRIARTDIIGSPGRMRGGRGRPRVAGADAVAHALLEGATVRDVLRHGKQMAIVAADGRALVMQLGMSGRVLLARHGDAAPAHTHAEWSFSGCQRMRFVDPRRFGALVPCRTRAELDTHWSGLGPDALEIGSAALHDALAQRRAPVKAVLLDQSAVAGLGNIYVDEALHRARIHPCTAARRAAGEAPRLLECIREVLDAAISAGGSTLRDYVDADGQPGAYVQLHRIYGRAGQPCDACGGTVRSTVVGGRTTAYCPTCQVRRRSRK